ncbi:MAG TPA: hypothetical protein VLF40_03420 [Candidatus Saccharimonadales bacterium]|nr:hypothetical protein [Candidatus Saccharimonadales bacterium]
MIVLVPALGLAGIAAPSASAACSQLPAGTGRLVHSITVETTGNYRLWLRLLAPASDSNSASVQVDQECPVTITVDKPGSSFVWFSQQAGGIAPLSFTLSAGLHTITIAGNKAGIGVDTILLAPGNACQPMGDGSNCSPAAITTGQKTATREISHGARLLVLAIAALIGLGSGGFLVLKYLAFTGRAKFPGAITKGLVVGGGPAPAADGDTSIAAFIRRHPAPLLICSGAIIAAIVVGLVAAGANSLGFEAENAALSDGAKIVSSQSALGGKYVELDAATASTQTTPGGTTAGGKSGNNTGGSNGGGSSGQSGGSSSGGSSGGGGTNNGSSTCPLPKYPNPSCTGVPVGTSLTTHNGDYEARTDGEVINAWHVTGNIIVYANNVTIKNSQVDGDIVKEDTPGYPLTIMDTTIGLTTGCDPDPAINTDTDSGNYTALRVLLRHHSDGFRTGGANITIRDSYAQICSVSSADHSDAVQDYPAGNHLVIDHTTLDLCLPWTTPPTSSSCNIAGANAAIFVGDSPNSVITNNLLIGGGYTFDVYKPAGWVVTGNRVLNNTWVYAPYSTNAECSKITTWSDNTVVTLNADYTIASTVRTESCPA